MELIAHRAGNSVAGITEAKKSGADLVEVDLHLGRGGLVARHAKRLWLTGRYWERWFVVPKEDTRFVQFSDVVVAAESTELWCDLKGVSRRLARDLVNELDDSGRRTTVSTKSWWILDPLVSLGHLRLVRSAGNRFELWLLEHARSRQRLDGVVVHSRLLSAEVVSRLVQRHGAVFTWSVHDETQARSLASWGVAGLIIDDLTLLERLSG